MRAQKSKTVKPLQTLVFFKAQAEVGNSVTGSNRQLIKNLFGKLREAISTFFKIKVMFTLLC